MNTAGWIVIIVGVLVMAGVFSWLVSGLQRDVRLLRHDLDTLTEETRFAFAEWAKSSLRPPPEPREPPNPGVAFGLDYPTEDGR